MKFKLLIVFAFISVVINFYLVSLLSNNDASIDSLQTHSNVKIDTTKPILEQSNERQKINRNFFPDKIELKDYSTVKYTLENSWKDIIKTIRELHKTPTLISKAYRDKDLCAGFIWSLSEEIWWEYIPYYIWMMTPDEKVPAKARELPYSYKSFGWEILIDFSDMIDLSNFKDTFWNNISQNDLLQFFSFSFLESSLLWDIWFLYKDTKHIEWLLSEWVYNSHVAKNMWLSEFIKQINFDWEFDNHELVFRKLFDIQLKNISKLDDVLSSYLFFVNWKEIIYKKGSFYYLEKEKYIWDRVSFKLLDNISYIDVTIAHYYKGEWKVDSLLNLVLWWDFLPINIMTVNSRFIEKM